MMGRGDFKGTKRFSAAIALSLVATIPTPAAIREDFYPVTRQANLDTSFNILEAARPLTCLIDSDHDEPGDEVCFTTMTKNEYRARLETVKPLTMDLPFIEVVKDTSAMFNREVRTFDLSSDVLDQNIADMMRACRDGARNALNISEISGIALPRFICWY